MRYETPQLTELTTAINAIQVTGTKFMPPNLEQPGIHETGAVEDWE
jgi:hypothetical protein